MMIKIAAIVLSLAFLRGGAAAEVNINGVAVAGKPFTILCGPVPEKGVVLWGFRNVYSSVYEEVFDGSEVRQEFFTVNMTNDGFSNLTKTYSNASDAGTYTCIIKQRACSANCSHIIIETNLIILDNELECEANTTYVKEGDYQGIQCRVNYTGDISPTIEWQRSDGKNSSFDAEILYSGREIASKYAKKLEASFTKQLFKSDNNVTFRFSLLFSNSFKADDDMSKRKTTAYFLTHNYAWLYKPTVLFAPKSVNIAPRKDYYKDGDVLGCVADGNPPPTYKWMEHGSDLVVVIGPTLAVNVSIMNNKTYQCIASNNLADVNSSVSATVTISFLEQPGIGFDGKFPALWIGIAAGVISVTVLAIAFAVACTRPKVYRSFRSLMERPNDIRLDVVRNSENDIQDVPRNGKEISKDDQLVIYAEINEGGEGNQKAVENVDVASEVDTGKGKHLLPPAVDTDILTSQQKTIVGADVSEYMDMNACRSPGLLPAPFRHLSIPSL